jgi:hypothetical protein
VFVWLVPVTVAGQGPASGARSTAPSATPRTAWGDPDLQGVWTYKTITPLQRPLELAGRQVLTEEEAAAFEQDENRRLNRDLVDPAKGGYIYPPESEGGVVPYNDFWYDRGTQVVASRRTSLIVDPPDGQLPPLTPEAQRRADAAPAREDQRGRPRADSYEDRPLSERCILMGNAAPMLSGAYNNNVQLFQAPGYVVLLNEMIHDIRIIPLDERPHLPEHVRLWLGDSRGRWEGDTLVVETKNFTGKRSFRGSGESMSLVERFTRVDADTVSYEFTVNDVPTWTSPWTVEFPLSKMQDEIYEYACHEGNYGIAGVLGGARADEKDAREAAAAR